jgi:hypothetical protein
MAGPAMEGAVGQVEIVFDPHVSQAIGLLLMALIVAAVALALGPGGRR